MKPHMTANENSPPRWQRIVLIASGIHSGIWAAFIIALPAFSAQVYGFARTPHELHLWQGTGLFIGLLAIGYVMGAENPRQHLSLIHI